MGESSFHAFVRELFAPMGPVLIKRMFGGAGVYAEGLMFALLADETIYIKTDDALKAALRAEGCGPFVWIPDSGPRKGEHVELSYWRMPDAALDDPNLATMWARKALAVSRAKAKIKTSKTSKRATRKAAKR